MKNLSKIEVECCQCGQKASCEEIQLDVVRYHKPNGNAIRFGKEELTEDQEKLLKSIKLTCELCHEED